MEILSTVLLYEKHDAYCPLFTALHYLCSSAVLHCLSGKILKDKNFKMTKKEIEETLLELQNRGY